MERIAHRGAKRELPENSLPAFERAYQRGADGVELDVHCTLDGVVVVHHDPSLGRLWAGRAIADMTWAEVASVDLGHGVGIPRLADVLAATPANRTVYVELKGANVEQPVVDVLRASPARCAVHSFEHAAIIRLRAIAPEIPRGVLFEDREADILAIMAAAGARDVWPQFKLIDQPLIERIHDAGGRVMAWTVNDVSVADRLASWGVDGLCGDDVRLLPTRRGAEPA